MTRQPLPAQLTFAAMLEQPALPAIRVAFRSGMSRTKDFWGAAAAGVPIGVVASELSLAARITGLPRFLQRGGFLFIDSGAFSEIKTGVAPDFDRVLSVYEDLVEDAAFAGYTPDRLYVVSPDKVGDQLATLERIARYQARIKALIVAGCRVIVPIQRGVMPTKEMLARVVGLLGTDRFVAGIPSNREAMSADECRTLKHDSFHILGRVQADADQVARLLALAENNPECAITADANWLRSRMTRVCELADRERRSTGTLSNIEQVRRMSPRTAAITAAIRMDKTWAPEKNS